MPDNSEEAREFRFVVWSSRLLLGAVRIQLTLGGLLPASEGGPLYRIYQRYAMFCIVVLVHIHWIGVAILGAIAEGRGSAHYGTAFMVSAEVFFVAYTPVYILARRYLASDQGLQFLAHGLCNSGRDGTLSIERVSASPSIGRRLSQMLSNTGSREKTHFMKWYPIATKAFFAFSLCLNLFTVMWLVLLASLWTDSLDDHRSTVYMSHIGICLYVIPHQQSALCVMLFLPWLVGNLHCKDLEQFQQSAIELFESFLAGDIDRKEVLRCLDVLEKAVALRCRKTSSYWSPIVMLMLVGPVCFGLGMAYAVFLTHQMDVIDRAPLGMAVFLKFAAYVWVVLLLVTALVLPSMLALVTDTSAMMLRGLENLNVMEASRELWGDAHAYTTHVRQLSLNMQVCGRDFNLSSVVSIASSFVVGVMFVFLSAVLERGQGTVV